MKQVFILFTLLFLITACSNPEDQNKENDDQWIHVDDIQVLFSPNNNIDLRMINEIEKAKESLSVAIYDLTSNKITNAFINAHKRGVEVRVYVDKNIGQYEVPYHDKLRENGITVQVADPKNWSNVQSHFAIMHNKIIIIDQDIVITGSYNFTSNAEENNRENLIIIPNKIIAKRFYDQFNIYWSNP